MYQKETFRNTIGGLRVRVERRRCVRYRVDTLHRLVERTFLSTINMRFSDTNIQGKNC